MIGECIKKNGGYSPWVSTEGRIVQGVESIVVCQHNVCVVVQQQRQHVISFLRDGIVQGRVTLRVLSTSRTQVRIMQSNWLMDGWIFGANFACGTHCANCTHSPSAIDKMMEEFWESQTVSIYGLVIELSVLLFWISPLLINPVSGKEKQGNFMLSKENGVMHCLTTVIWLSGTFTISSWRFLFQPFFCWVSYYRTINTRIFWWYQSINTTVKLFVCRLTKRTAHSLNSFYHTK